MIVVDTNIVAYLYLPCNYTAQAEELLMDQHIWAAPYLWKSEFRNILDGYILRKSLSFEHAVQIQHEAEKLLAGFEYEVSSSEILSLVNRSNCSAYDCEFIALAVILGTKLITMDKQILAAFPDIALPLGNPSL